MSDHADESKTEEELQAEEDQRTRDRFQGAPREDVLAEIIRSEIRQGFLEAQREWTQDALAREREEITRQEAAAREARREQAALVEVLRHAPPDIRAQFQQQIDLFDQEERILQRRARDIQAQRDAERRRCEQENAEEEQQDGSQQ
jgi:hypothetical protein